MSKLDLTTLSASQYRKLLREGKIPEEGVRGQGSGVKGQGSVTPREIPQSAFTLGSNPHPEICRACCNVLCIGPRYLCKYHGCRHRTPIERIAACPKEEF